ncbi:hypothetical protein BDN72DRAFT_769275, partial [Pluteus cervinus]
MQTQFEVLFSQPIKQLPHEVFQSQCIVIDALDECGSESDQLILLEIFLKLVKMCSWIKIFITSCCTPTISQFFGVVSVLKYELTLSNSWDDVVLYFQIHLPSLLTNVPQEDVSNMSLLMADYSQGLFIWAQTAYMFLKSSPDFQAAVSQLVHTQNRDSAYANLHLHQLYDLVLTQAIPDTELQSFEYIMGSIILSKNLLSVDTLSHLLYPIISSGLVLNTVKALQPLLCIDNSGCLQIIHPSLAEYLLAEESKKFHINTEFIHQVLFQQSINIMFKQLKFNICQLETSYLKNNEIDDLDLKIQENISPELQYACLYWSHHLILTEGSNPQSSSLLKVVFVNIKTIMWIECLSLLNKIYHGIDAIKKLHQWLNKVNPCQVLEFYEVYYFMHKFYIPIVMSTPHIYLSALPFAPVHSAIYRKCSYILPSPLLESSTTNQQWQANGLLFPVFKDSICVIKLSPKDNLIYSGYSDGTIGIWNPYTGEPITILSGHEKRITALLLAQNSKILISGSVDTTIRFWDTITCKSLHQPLYCHTRTITSIALSTDDSALYCGSLDKTISIWN